ncbi:MAG: efflux RND transporter periplasmic adaptor subunit, partial [Lentisphaeria bacterium]|nr:efflux RND transporter periplasmic adaptor subunit [Lentisphaeria bacterium]
KAEYAFAKRNLARQQALWNKKATSESTYDEAVRQEAVSKAAVEAAEAALLDAENNLSYTRIISPLDGKAGKAALSEGNYVTPSSGDLINIVALDKMYVNFWISMNDYLSLFNGSYETLKKEGKVKVFLADGSEFAGKSSIVFIDNRVVKDTDTIRIRLLVDNDGMKLLPDGLVTVRIGRKDSNKCAVPVSAIMNNGQISFVYVLDQENKAAVRPVELGEVQGRDQVILKGLQEGETVVFDGTHKVFPGSKVNPVAAVESK